ncbi:MAG TPA: hypothetical protein VOA78_11800 [Candidatus Dormibacteraeota bacterium]|nr:hypothetical protein [Candidatus Dormibacteraeota bacterium]
MPRKLWICSARTAMLALACGLALGAASAAWAQDMPDKSPTKPADRAKPKKVWTDDDLRRPGSPSDSGSAGSAAGSGTATASGAGSAKGAAAGDAGKARRERYARELQPLREELAKVDAEIRSLQEARKDGKGTADAASLEEDPAGVTSDAQMEMLQSEHAELQRKIDEVEQQASHGAAALGDLRSEQLAPSGGAAASSSGMGKELEQQIAEEKEQLERSEKESQLLQQDLGLEKQQEASSADAPSRSDKSAVSAATASLLNGKQVASADLEKKIAELEVKLKSEQVSAGAGQHGANAKSGGPESPIDDALANAADVETQWKKQFATIDFKIRTVKTQLDILQRELNLGPAQDAANSSTPTNDSIHKSIDDKKKELVDLTAMRAQLAEQLRQAGLAQK